MKNELQALTDLCRLINVGEDGVVQPRQTTLLACRRCCKEYGFENIEGNIWVAKTMIDIVGTPGQDPDTESSDAVVNNSKQKFISNLCTSLYELLDVGTSQLNGPMSRSCPYLVKFIDSFPDSASDGQCLVLEYLRWGSLQECVNAGRVLNEVEIAVVAYSILSALVYMKEHNYIHRDVKVCNM